MRWLLAVACAVLPLTGAARPFFPASPPPGWRLPALPLPAPRQPVVPATLPVELPDGTVVTLDLEEYLKGVLPREIGASFPAEAQKAQAVAARSYALYYVEAFGPICTTTTCQVWGPEHTAETDAAVEATRGQVMTWQDAVVPIFFAASCGGHTLDAADVWGGQAPWLTPGPCLENKQGACEVVCTPDVPAGPACWGIHGHRIGLCQRGAEAMAGCGSDYRAILAHYAGNAELYVPDVAPVDVVEVVETEEAVETIPEPEREAEDEVVDAADVAPFVDEDGPEPSRDVMGGCGVGRPATHPGLAPALAILLLIARRTRRIVRLHRNL
jgi:hypothetical protein